MPSIRTNGIYYVRRHVPGWGWMEMSLGTRDAQVAAAVEQSILEVARLGRKDLVDAVADRRIAPLEFHTVKSYQGIDGLVRRLEELEREEQERQREEDDPFLDDLIHQFQENPPEHRRGGAIREKTLEGYVQHLNGIHDWAKRKLKRRPRLSDLDEKFLLRYRTDYVSKMATKGDPIDAGKKTATANRYISSLSKLLGTQVKEGRITSNPASKVRLSSARENPTRQDTYTYFETDEVRLLRKAAREVDLVRRDMGRIIPDALWIDTMLATGATTYNEGGELCLKDLKMKHVVEGMVEIRVGGTKSEHRPRDVWIPHSLAVRLADHSQKWRLGRGKPFFPFSKKAALFYWKRIVEHLVAQGHDHFEETSPYDMRHTFAVHAIRGNPEEGMPGVDIGELSKLLGHSSITTTMMYAKHAGRHTPEILARNAKVLGLL